MKYRFLLILVTGFIFISNCSDALDDSSDSAMTSQSYDIAHPGIWTPPWQSVNRAAGFRIENRQAGLWRGPVSCSRTGTYTPRAAYLRNFVLNNFNFVNRIGGYNCRPIAGTNQTSVHATGRALDIFIPTYNGQADNTKGDWIANWLLDNAEYIGIQTIIWDRGIWWSPSANQGVTYYGGSHPHHDHIHVELSP